MTTHRTPFRLVAAIAAGTAAALVMAGCSSGGTASTSSSSSKPVDGGSLTYAIANDPITLNPAGTGAGNDTFAITRQLVDSLLWQDPSDGSLTPWLATKYSANADATAFTFDLRSGVTFSDGTAFDATAVKDTFDDIASAGASSTAAAYFSGYEGTKVVDDDTVEVDFGAPNAAFPNATASVALGIVAPKTTETPFDDRADGKAVIGTGPFTLSSYTKNTSTILTKRKDYDWGPAARGLSGAAHLSKVTFQVVPEASVRTGSLQSGQLDAISSVQPSDVDVLKSQYELVTRANPGQVFGLTFNQKRPIVSDLAVRKAIAQAVDPKAVRDTALNDLFTVADSVLGSTTPGYADTSSGSATYDPKAAAAALDDAGWEKGSDGIRTKDGTKLQLKLVWITNFGPNQTSLELIQQELGKVGVGVTLESGTVPQYLANLTSGDWDLSWDNSSRADGDVLRSKFSSSGAQSIGASDTTLDALFTKELSQSSASDRSATFGEIQQRIASQVDFVPVHELTSIIAPATDVHGIVFGADTRLDQLTGAWKDAS
ncbi:MULTISPECIES: ABC transporter substrate-binding protein [unclassified Curtobacterium]|uniref:ABC transporter substrate-binding protein n=1 Tax=unclassified Curtobacterium TaxID=257496 RepID=UPI000FA45EC9|nr:MULTISPECIES: ABC transporter substrate-binding protein [unclassified Curtobacterium]ROQ06038.1 peptide/nickel transport system substrate-binding protein [Curtobacterium sp. PhB171]ROQ22815.1 peptide/nickel transport system substrate-binding protein [Curtobacterium sp. PhB170]ROS34233.1 peptide/nickel transport system substrate-binding protein [Curtobacterium sp. PhB131]ROS66832.1 peptide/nickel transport system substrate-binding protein [Curtobacterium sp. PhB141]